MARALCLFSTRFMKFALPLLLAPLVTLAALEPLPPFSMSVERLDPALDALIPKDTKVEKCAEGFNWSEGPAWFKSSVVFSDVPENVKAALEIVPISTADEALKWALTGSLTPVEWDEVAEPLTPTPPPAAGDGAAVVSH